MKSTIGKAAAHVAAPELPNGEFVEKNARSPLAPISLEEFPDHKPLVPGKTYPLGPYKLRVYQPGMRKIPYELWTPPGAFLSEPSTGIIKMSVALDGKTLGFRVHVQAVGDSDIPVTIYVAWSGSAAQARLYEFVAHPAPEPSHWSFVGSDSAELADIEFFFPAGVRIGEFEHEPHE